MLFCLSIIIVLKHGVIDLIQVAEGLKAATFELVSGDVCHYLAAS